MAQETPSVITEITSNSNWKTNTKGEFNLQNDILNQNYRQLVSNSENPLTKKKQGRGVKIFVHWFCAR